MKTLLPLLLVLTACGGVAIEPYPAEEADPVWVEAGANLPAVEEPAHVVSSAAPSPAVPPSLSASPSGAEEPQPAVSVVPSAEPATPSPSAPEPSPSADPVPPAVPEEPAAPAPLPPASVEEPIPSAPAVVPAPSAPVEEPSAPAEPVCDPAPVWEDEGRQLVDGMCVAVPLPLPDRRVLELDDYCAGNYPGFGHAWVGSAGLGGTECVGDTVALSGSLLACCVPADPCLERPANSTCGDGYATRVYACDSAPSDSCVQAVARGRLLNEWCCE